MPSNRPVSLRPSALRFVRLGSVPSESADDLAFLQQRLGLYGLTVAVIAGLFVIVGILAHWAVGRDYFAEPSRPAHFAGTAVAVALFSITKRRRAFSDRILGWIDALATLGMCLAFVVMAHEVPAPGLATLIATLCVSYVTLGRAAQVPSTPARTAMLTGLSFSMLVVSAALRPIPAEYPPTSTGRLFSLLDPILWCISGTVLATVASKVIYGLQEKVIEARQLGQYTLEAKIGQGGMGEIYRARHAMLRRRTAIKLLAGDNSEAQLRRFEREVQLTASLTHPNTICVFDYGRTPNGVFYYAMELLDGLNLETLIERHGPQPAGRVVKILLQVCGALSEAHGVGLIHRDVKPANIHLCRLGGIQDFVKVLDFGLVRQIESDGSATLSGVQQVVGTPLYMAPEAIVSPDRVDARTDLYALGATGYFLLTGTPPFAAASAIELCGHHLHTAPVPPSERGVSVPGALERIVLACLAKDPSARPASASELARLLETADGIAPWTHDDCKRFWESDFESTPSPEQSVAGARTIQIALAEREMHVPDSRDGSVP